MTGDQPASDDNAKPAIYVYSYPMYLEAAERDGTDPLLKIGMTEREAVQRIAQQQRQTGSLEAPEILRVWDQEPGQAHQAERLIHGVLDAFELREAGETTGSEVFRVSLERLDKLAIAFGWAASKPRKRVVAGGGGGAASDAWRTGRNTAVTTWGFTYPQCARPGCGVAIEDESPRGEDGKYVYCSEGCASSDDAIRQSAKHSPKTTGGKGGSSAAKDAWRTGRNAGTGSWGFNFPQCARPKCGKAIDDSSPTGSDGQYRYCSQQCATTDDADRAPVADTST